MIDGISFKAWDADTVLEPRIDEVSAISADDSPGLIGIKLSRGVMDADGSALTVVSIDANECNDYRWAARHAAIGFTQVCADQRGISTRAALGIIEAACRSEAIGIEISLLDRQMPAAFWEIAGSLWVAALAGPEYCIAVAGINAELPRLVLAQPHEWPIPR